MTLANGLKIVMIKDLVWATFFVAQMSYSHLKSFENACYTLCFLINTTFFLP